MKTTEKTFYALYAPDYDKFLSWRIGRDELGKAVHVSHASGCGGTGWLSNKPGRTFKSVEDADRIIEEINDYFASDTSRQWGPKTPIIVVKVFETRGVEAA